jgi:hypothetical protein
MRIRTTATALAVLAALTLAGCSSSSGGSDDDAPAAPGTAAATGRPAAGKAGGSDRDALTAAVADYTAKLFAGDPSGYDDLSARCKQQMTHDAWTQLAKEGHQQYGSQKATGITVDQLSGNLARVSYGAGHIPQFDRKAQPWVREGGAWRWDAC